MSRPPPGRPSETAPRAALDELEQGMGHLQEKVEYLAGGRVLAVDMFQFESPVLLDVEAFILDFPAESSSFIRERRDALGRH